MYYTKPHEVRIWALLLQLGTPGQKVYLRESILVALSSAVTAAKTVRTVLLSNCAVNYKQGRIQRIHALH